MQATQKKKGRRGYHAEGWPIVWHRSAKRALLNDASFIEANDCEKQELIKDWCREKLARDGVPVKGVAGISEDKAISSGSIQSVGFKIYVDTRNYVLEVGTSHWFYSTLPGLYNGIIEKVAKEVLCKSNAEVPLRNIIDTHRAVVKEAMEYIGVSKDVVAEALG